MGPGDGSDMGQPTGRRRRAAAADQQQTQTINSGHFTMRRTAEACMHPAMSDVNANSNTRQPDTPSGAHENDIPPHYRTPECEICHQTCRRH